VVSTASTHVLVGECKVTRLPLCAGGCIACTVVSSAWLQSRLALRSRRHAGMWM
jgi:hypothetical protein